MGKFSGAVLHVRKFRGAIITDESKVPVFPVTPNFPVTPDVPEASLYLYGRPVEDGVELSKHRHIGVRRGDVVTYYNAEVLPQLPAWDKTANPHGYLNRGGVGLMTVYFNVYPVPLRSEDGTVGYPDIEEGTSIPCRICSFNKTGFGWNEFGDYFIADGGGLSDVFWANVNVYDKTDGSLYMSATDPIPVTGEIVDYINDIPIYEVI